MAPSDGFRCTKCGAENRSDRLFCTDCGAYLGSHEGQVDRFQPPVPSTSRSTVAKPLHNNRGTRHLLGVALLAVFVAVCAILFLFIRQQLDAVQSPATTVRAVTTSTAPPTTSGGTTTSSPGSSTTGTSILPRVIPGRAQASSTLPATEEYSYAVGNLSDGDLTTSWQEGEDGTGEGQWLLFTFNQPVTVERIDVANGYQRDQQRFNGNARVRTMRMDFSSGQSQEIQLFDDMGYQQVVPALESGQTITSVKMTILSVYPGDEWDDLALSEVKFIGSR